MYRGEVMESGEMRDIFAEPRHPYLKALLRAVPRFDMHPGERLVPIREIKSAGGKMLDATSEPWPAGADAAGPLLSVAQHHQAVRDAQVRLVQPQARRRRRARRRRCQLRDPPGRMPWAGRRVRLRQDHAVQDPDAGAGARYRRHPVQRPGQHGRCAGAGRRRADQVPPQSAIHLPGPVQLAEPAHDGVRHRRRTADHPRHGRQRAPPRAGQGVDEPCRSGRAAPEALPAQLLRRAAPAHRHRPRPGAAGPTC